MENLEFNKTKDEKMKVVCSECKGSKNHLVLLSADIDGHEDLGQFGSIDWDSHYQIIQCQGCDLLSFRKIDSNSEDYIEVAENEWEHRINEKLYPQRSINTLTIKDFINTPYNLRRIYREVIDCYNNNSLTLCGAGVRAIIDGLCTENGVKNGPVETIKKDGTKEIIRKRNLEGKISGMFEKGLLTKKHANILHEHRFMGNEAVHSLDQPSLKELELAISIVEHTLDNIYEIEVKASELRQRKKQRKNA